MAIRNIRKNLAGMEDLLVGVGTEEQARGGSTYTMGKIDMPYAVSSQAEMTALDVTLFTRARVYSSTTEFVDYIYDPLGSSGIAPDIGAGYWVLARTPWVAFPATQVPSSDANTLDDYEENSWTPAITFATAGDLAVTYAVQVGSYTKVGRRVKCAFRLGTSAFAHTTASGNLQITGLPVAMRTATNLRFMGSISVGGVTKATYTQFNCVADSATSLLTVQACGSGVAPSNVTAANMPTGGSVVLEGEIEYESA